MKLRHDGLRSDDARWAPRLAVQLVAPLLTVLSSGCYDIYRVAPSQLAVLEQQQDAADEEARRATEALRAAQAAAEARRGRPLESAREGMVQVLPEEQALEEARRDLALAAARAESGPRQLTTVDGKPFEFKNPQWIRLHLADGGQLDLGKTRRVHLADTHLSAESMSRRGPITVDVGAIEGAEVSVYNGTQTAVVLAPPVTLTILALTTLQVVVIAFALGRGP